MEGPSCKTEQMLANIRANLYTHRWNKIVISVTCGVKIYNSNTGQQEQVNWERGE